MTFRSAALGLLYLWMMIAASPVARGQILNWQTGQVIPGTEGITPGPGADLRYWSSEAYNLRYADLTDAVVAGAFFRSTTGRGFTKEQLYSTASYKSGNLSGIGLDYNNLSGWNFSGQNLTGAWFGSATLDNADLKQANLSKAHLSSTKLVGANLTGANLRGADFRYATLTGANLREANLAGADVHFASLTAADLTDALVDHADFSSIPSQYFTKEQLYSTASYKSGNLTGINLELNDLSGWNFARQNLKSAHLGYAILTGADLTDAVIAGASFFDAGHRGLTENQLQTTASYKTGNLTGVRLHGGNLTAWSFAGLDLTGADLSYADMTGANLREANLTKATFAQATLTGADLADAVIAGANFAGATANGFTKEQLYSTASYKNRDLTGIQLGYNDLTGWNLAGQNLTNVWFDSATLTDTDLSFADLRGGYIFQGRAAAILRNAIMPDGAIDTLNMETSEQLTVRDYEKPTIWDHDIPLTVRSGMTLADGSVLEMIFADETWGSTMVLAGGFTPDLGGTLR